MPKTKEDEKYNPANKKSYSRSDDLTQDEVDKSFGIIADENPDLVAKGDQIEADHASKLKDQESQEEADKNKEPSSEGEESLYNSTASNNKFSSRLKGVWNSKKGLMIAAGSGGLLGIILVFFSIFGVLSTFKLDNLMGNIETKAFQRYQVSMEGRTTKWAQAYMSARLMEIDNPDLDPGDRDNLLFRSDRVDKNNPFVDWYRTMRTSTFEQDVFERNGIKMTSAARWDGNKWVVRPAVIDLNIDSNKQITLDLDANTLRQIENGDVDVFNTRVRDFVDVNVFENDKDARRYIKKMVKENTHWWQYIKRWHVRKNIQNMTGVRNWRFFENTRDKYNEKKIDIRNKIIVKALPESTKAGKFVQCLFGISLCRNTSDPNSPDNRSPLASTTGETKDADGKTETTEDRDGNKTTTKADPSNGDGAVNGYDGSANPDADGSTKYYRALMGQILGKLNIATTLVSVLDTIYRIDQFIGTGALIKIVVAAKAAQAVGAFQTFSTANDQIKTGEFTSDEMNELMQVMGNVTNNEGWRTAVLSSGGSNIASALSEDEPFRTARDKEEYCSATYQEAMKLEENRRIADKQYHYLCDEHKVGVADNAEEVTNWWNRILTLSLIKPVLEIYSALPIKDIFNWLDSALQRLLEVTGFTALLKNVLAATGLDEKIESFVAWMGHKILAALGGGPMLTGGEPAGVFVNMIVQGAAVTAESSTRQQGGIASNAETTAYNNKLLARYKEDYIDTQSNYEKHFALSNYESTASKVAFSFVSDVDTTSTTQVALGITNNIAKAPIKLLSNPVSAQSFNDNPKSLQEFSGYQAFDIPPVCQEMDILGSTPQEMTNADDLGLIDPSALNWDLVRDNNAFWDEVYPAIYEREPVNPDDLAFTIYNCGPFDATVSGGLGRPYGWVDDFGYTDTQFINNPTVGSGGDFRIASFNVLGNSHTATGGKKASWNSGELRMQEAYKKIEQLGLEAVGFQEIQAVQRNKFRDLAGSKWTLYPSGNDAGLLRQNSIAWRNDSFDFIEGGSRTNLQYFGNNQMSVPWAKLRHKESDTVFYLTNTHDPINRDGANWETRKRNAEKHLAWAQEKISAGFPVFVTGDFNSGFNINTGSGAPNRTVLPYCIMTDGVKLVNSYDAKNGDTDRKCPTTNAGTDNSIDHIYHSKTQNMSINKWVRDTSVKGDDKAPWNDEISDHPIVYADVVFAGSESGGWTWPISDEDFLPINASRCFDPAPPTPGHTGVDIPVTNKNVLAANSGVVLEAGNGGDAGNYILIDHKNGYFSNYQHLSQIDVSTGDKVSSGQQIGISGNTGYSFGAHLHFGISRTASLNSRNNTGSAIEPTKLLPPREDNPCS